MAESPASGSRKRRKTTGDKRLVRDEGKTPDARYFHSDESYDKFVALNDKPVTPLKCWDLSLLQSRPMRELLHLLNEYSLVKLVTYNAKCYPRLVKMFYSNVGVADGKASNYVMGKKVVMSVESFVKLFDMNGEAAFKQSKDLEEYSRDEAIRVLFPNNPPTVVTGKTLTSGLSVVDRLLHYTIVKCILPRATNTTALVEDDLFLMWALKTRKDINIPYLMIHYLANFSSRVPSFLPYGMVLTEFFKAAKVAINLEKEVANIDNTTWINEKTLHSMQLRLVEGTWVRGDGTGGRRFEAGGSSSAAPAGASGLGDSAADLLRGLKIQQTEFMDYMKNYTRDCFQQLQGQITSLDTKMEEGFTELHTRMNSMKSQLNEIQQQVTPEEP